jgi:hypothetical protein
MQGGAMTDSTPAVSEAHRFLIYRLRQIVAGGPLAYDAIATDEAADTIADLTRQLAEAQAAADEWKRREAFAVSDLQRELRERDAALADARRDALRYQIVRVMLTTGRGRKSIDFSDCTPAKLDAAIDAATSGREG